MKIFLRALCVPVLLVGFLTVSSAAAGAITGNEGLFVGLLPARIADTRPAPQNVGVAAGQIPANVAIVVPVAGLGGLPGVSSILAVVLNVTVVNPTGAGFLTVYPSSSTLPSSSNLNYVGGDLRANQVTVPLGADGAVYVYAGVSPTDVVIDVNGYFTSASGSASGASALTSNVTPNRVLDTRPESLVGEQGPYPANQVHNFCLGASETAAVVGINVTIVQPSSDAFLTVFPAGSPQPLASSVNAKADKIVSNFVTMTVGASRCISLFNNVSMHVVVDVFGRWSTPVANQGRFVALASLTRLYDTRPNSGISPNGVTSPGRAVDLQIGGLISIPAGVRGVLFNLTAVDAFDPGYLTAYSAAVCPRPVVSNVNYIPEQAIPNTVLSAIGTSCEGSPAKSDAVSIYHHAGGYFIVDVAGYFTAS